MVKRIEKTYSVKNDQIKKSVTLSTEESLSSQSPTSYSSNTPARHGFIDDSGVIQIGFGALVMNYPFPSQSPVSDSSNTPVVYGWGWLEKLLLDDIPNWARGNAPEYRPDLGGDKSSYTKVGYDGIYGGGNPLYDFIAESNDTPTYYQNEIVF